MPAMAPLSAKAAMRAARGSMPRPEATSGSLRMPRQAMPQRERRKRGFRVVRGGDGQVH